MREFIAKLLGTIKHKGKLLREVYTGFGYVYPSKNGAPVVCTKCGSNNIGEVEGCIPMVAIVYRTMMYGYNNFMCLDCYHEFMVGSMRRADYLKAMR